MLTTTGISTALWLVAASVSVELPPVPRPNPVHPVDYVAWLNDAFAVKKDDNAASVYVRLWALPNHNEEIDFDDPDSDVDLLTQATKRPWSGDKFKPVEMWVSVYQPQITLLREAAAFDRCFLRIRAAEDWTAPPVQPRAWFGALRGMHQTVRASGWGAVARGDAGSIFDHMLLYLRAAHHTGQQPLPIEAMTGQAMANLAYETMLDALAAADDPAGLADTWLPRLRAIDPEFMSAADRFNLDRLECYRLLQEMATVDATTGAVRFRQDRIDEYAKLVNDLRAYPYKMAGVPVEGKPLDPEGWAAADFEQTVQALDSCFELMLTWPREPFSEVAHGRERLSRAITATRNPIVAMLLEQVRSPESLERWYTSHVRGRSERRGVRLVFAVLTYRHETGRLPDRLDALNGLVAAETVVDPLCGEPYVYSTDGGTFRLYSRHLDGDDDGGGDGDRLLWPRSKE